MKFMKRQRGVSLPVILIGGAIMLVIATSIYSAVRLESLRSRGKALSTAVQPYHGALLAYALSKRVSLVNGTPTVAGVTVPTAPTCVELRTIMPALLDYSCSLPEGAGTPLFSVTPIPTGCSGTACDLALAVTTGRPVGVDADGSEIVGAAVKHFGAEAGQTLVGDGSTIRGTGWSRTNPLGNQPRTFGTYATYGASTLSNFVTLFDIRDPNFLGHVTIAQTLSVTGTITSVTSVGVGDGSCKYAELVASGRIVARSPSCVDRVVADGSAGTIETRSTTGSTTVRISDSVQVFNSAGTDKAGFRFVASVSEAYADRFRNNSSTAGINEDGSVFGTTATVASLVINTSQTVGTACPAGAFARSTDGRWMECFASLWRYSGIHQANVGDACVGGFAQDLTDATAPLICRNSVYVNLNQAVGLVSIIDSLVVTDGTVVAAPSCPATATSILMTDLTRFQTPAAGGTTRLGYTGTGPWTISITGAGGGEAVVWRGCRYPNF